MTPALSAEKTSPCAFCLLPSAFCLLPSSLPVKSLLLQPILDETGDLVAVLVHHDHVRVAADADLRQVDDLIAAACAAHLLEEFDAVSPDRRPARIPVDVIAVHREDRRVAELVHLLGIAETGEIGR